MSETYTLADPPVVETVLGIQFSRIAELTNESMLAFARTCDGQWPNADVVPPVAEQFESFGQQPTFAPSARFGLQQELPIRLQLRNATRDRMIQIQSSKLYYNWIRAGDEDYPSYARINPCFFDMLARVQGFLDQVGAGPVRPNQWEVTYVNRIPRGDLWRGVGDVENVIPGVIGSARPVEPLKLERIEANWAFEIEPRRGRLHVSVQSHSAPEARDEAIILKLTARGPLSKGAGSDQIKQGFDSGHEAIIAAFRSRTSDAARQRWGEQVTHDGT